VQIRMTDFGLLPNLLSLLRLLLAIPLIFLIAQDERNSSQTLLYVVAIIAIASDYLDGYISRRWAMESDLGRVLDPIADKISMAAGLTALVLYRGLPSHILVLLLFRDVCIVVAGSFFAARSRQVLGAHWVGKLNTAVVSFGCLSFLIFPGTILTTALLTAATATIIVSAVVYYAMGERLLAASDHPIGKWACRMLSIGVLALVMHLSSLPVKTPEGALRQHEIYGTTSTTGLLRQYAPVIYLTNDEAYEPIAVDAFIDNALLVKGNSLFALLSRPSNHLRARDALQSLSDAPPESFLTVNASTFDSLRDTYAGVRGRYPRTVYTRALRIRADGQPGYILQYWMFFWASNAGSTRIPWHECDWEMIMLHVDESGQALRVGYSQHYYGEVRPWRMVETEQGHPVAYVAFGGHSMHFERGERVAYIDRLKKIPVAKDRCEKARQIGPDDYTLIEFDASIPWLRFRGSWGIPITTTLPGPVFRNPANSDLAMWTNPTGWLAMYSDAK
jgi:CDP-diacylglycerol--glycerol-3-phosphate 3-phosphatidyltransferase